MWMRDYFESNDRKVYYPLDNLIHLTTGPGINALDNNSGYHGVFGWFEDGSEICLFKGTTKKKAEAELEKIIDKLNA